MVKEELQPVQVSTLPARGRDLASAPDNLRALSLSTIGNGATGAEPSLMASITDALSKSQQGDSIDQTTSIGHSSIDPVPKYEPVTVSEGHGRTSDDTSSGKKRTTRRSTSPPVLPPGAAPAAIRAWDDGSGQGEDGAHSDHPASSSERASQQRISPLEADGEEEVGLAYDQDNACPEAEEAKDNDDKQSKIGGESFSEGEHEHATNARTVMAPTTSMQTPISATPSMQSNVPGPMTLDNEASDRSNIKLRSRGGSQHRIHRVPPPTLDTDSANMSPSSRPLENPYDVHSTEFIARDDANDEHTRNVAAALEVSREFDTLTWAAVSPANTYVPPQKTPQPLLGPRPASRQPSYEYSPTSPNRSPTSPVQATQEPSSPLAPPTAPFIDGSISPTRPTAPPLERPLLAYGDNRAPLPSRRVSSRGPPPFPQVTSPRSPQLDTPGAGSGASTGQRSPYRTPPEYARPAPPFSSAAMSRSTSSLDGNGGPGTPRMISAAAFRRQQQGRSPSNSGLPDSLGPADTSPLVLRRQSPAPAVPPKNTAPTRRLSVVNPDPHMASDDEGEYDYIAAYASSTVEGETGRSGHGHSPSQSQSMGSGGGYGAGKYVSEL